MTDNENSKNPFDKPFDFKEAEERIYAFWQKSGFFKPDFADQRRPETQTNAERGRRKSASSPHKSAFSMVLPPPNVTGTLHVGHAIMLAIEDVLARYHRMRGFKTLWIPGTDHAAIATQEKVEKELYKKEGKNRHDLGREEFLRRMEAFAQASHDTIVSQIRRMGASVDWSREAFTLDEARSLAVKTAFKRMYDAGLIYRGERIVNWDPKMQTTVSDEEIEWIEEKAPLYYLKYGPFVIATARPETKFGDKYVVMHPSDKRYVKYKHGDKLNVQWINGEVTATVIKDKAIDPKFGTGVMTITPWHDATDFEIAERHKLDKEQIIDLRGKLLPIAGEFAGKKIAEARSLIVEKLKAKGLVEKIDENYTHRVATSQRGGGKIEPQILKQWFVSVNSQFPIPNSQIKGIKSGSKTTLKEIMTKAVKGGQIKIVPKRFEKIYFHWIKNLRDWCISRQIWYGHRIPVWYHEPKCIPRQGHESEIAKCEEMIVAFEKPKCEFCDAEFVQDSDTLDTWFSSGLWSFSTLGWPFDDRQRKPFDRAQGVLSEDLRTYHPLSVLETGYDILFFWVARMILMSGFHLGDIPFRTVYLHGLVRDAQGRKMSKSLGNVIDPMEFVEKYGADALRMAMIVGNAPGSDLSLSDDKVRGYRNFATKIWNIARFIAMNDPAEATKAARGASSPELKTENLKLTTSDKKLIKDFERVKREVEKNIETFKLHLAAEKIYHYIWHTFADKIVEGAKSRLKDGNSQEKAAALAMLKEIFLGSIKALHPFMPFVTEEVYQQLFQPGNSKSIMI